MLKKTAVAVPLILLVAATLYFNTLATSKILDSQPGWYYLNLHSYRNFRHILGAGFGFRRLTADFDYMMFLQYYGDKENMKSRYANVYQMLEDITDADPHFTFAYTYGSAILAFNQKEYDKAVKIINKGLKYNPKFWKLRYYLAAITYKELGDKEKYISTLEEALKFEDHPAMIERLLGNIYEQYKPADEVAAYWLKIYRETGDKRTRQHAHERLMLILQSGKLEKPREFLNKL